MKRKHVLTLCLTILVSTSAHSMNPGSDDLEIPLEALTLAETEIRPNTPVQAPRQTPLRRTPLRELNNPRTTTPVRAIMPIDDDGRTTPGVELRTAAGTPTQGATPNTQTRQANEILAAEARGELTAARALNQLRAVFGPRAIPPSRANRENTPPFDQNQNTN